MPFHEMIDPTDPWGLGLASLPPPQVLQQGGFDPSVGGMVPGFGRQAPSTGPPDMGPPSELAVPNGFWERLAESSGGHPFNIRPRPQQGVGDAIAGFLSGFVNAKAARAAQGISDVEEKNKRIREAASILGTRRHELRQQAERLSATERNTEATLALRKSLMESQTVPVQMGGQTVRVKPGEVTGAVDYGKPAGEVAGGGPTLKGRNKPPGVGGGGGVYGAAFSQTDPNAIAKAIERGGLPPNLSQYSRLAQGPIATVLAKDGYNLTRAQLDFGAVSRHLSSLNGRMQLQIRQSASTVMPGLDDVVRLATRLNELSPSTAATPVNRLIVKGSREWGAMGTEAQDVATELNGQIATLIPELSNIYSAGGVPTDRAMILAGRILDPEWPLNRILAGVNRERANVQYRINSINSTTAITATSSAGGGFDTGTETPSGGKFSVTDPNGKIHPFDTQAQADAFKRSAGIK